MKAFGISLSALALVLSAANCICKGWWCTGMYLMLMALVFAILAYKSKS